MNYPKMTPELHLLKLMHQQVEEARSLGDAGPQLEYREDPSGLKIRIVGMDAVEEIHYGGFYGAGGGSQGAGAPLRRLSEAGYIEEDRESADPSAGTIAITEKGLEKLKYRLAFESNLPRYFKMWGISLLGRPREIGVSKLWRASWEGRSISVRNWHGVRLQRPEGYSDGYLNVDNRFPPGYRVIQSRFSRDLYGELRTRDGVSLKRKPAKSYLCSILKSEG